MGKLVDSSAETQIRLMNHLSKKIWDLDMPGLLDKFCSILNTILSRSSFRWPAIGSLAWVDTHS